MARGDEPEKPGTADDLAAAARLWGWILLVPGLAILAVGAWLLKEMIDEGVYSLQALACSGSVGGGLTLTGISRLRGARDDEG